MHDQQHKSDGQLKAEWDRFRATELKQLIYPQSPVLADALKVLEQLHLGIECLYAAEEACGQVTASWRAMMLICRCLSELQAYCSDKQHALEILRLLRIELKFQYQEGVQCEFSGDREHTLRVVSC
ncbi:MAG TPA: hypothetical protein VFR19_25325 [Hyphomicrobiaceae bacterium]|jgi:hypothetical protein|nr:hypothetical protein [Hyphomicrobiaceae bacterium]